MAALYTSPEYMHEVQEDGVRATFVLEVYLEKGKYVVEQVDIEDGGRWNSTPVVSRNTKQAAIDWVKGEEAKGWLLAALTPVETEDGDLTFL